MSWRDELEAILGRAGDAELPDLAGELARAQAIIALRLQRQDGRLSHDMTVSEPDGWLTPDAVAERLGVSRKWVYAHRAELGGRKIGGHVRLPERGVRRYLATKR
jgi:excisionase family DNA binding protein